MAVDLGGRTGPVDPCLRRGDLAGVGRFARLLRLDGAAALERSQRPRQERGADVRQPLGQGGGGVLRRDRDRLAEQDRTFVQAFGHAHDLDAGDPVAGHDGALDGGGPAPARQQAGVDVETAEAGRVEHLFQQDLAVGDDHGGVEIEGLEGGDLLGRLHAGGRADFEPQALREGMHRRGREHHAPTARPGRLGIDGRDLVPGGDQLREARHGEVGGSHEG